MPKKEEESVTLDAEFKTFHEIEKQIWERDHSKEEVEELLNPDYEKDWDDDFTEEQLQLDDESTDWE